MAAQRRAGRVRLLAGLTFGALGAAGSYLGTRLAASVNQHLLMLAFAVLLVIAATAMLLRQRRRSNDSVTSRPDPDPKDAGPQTVGSSGSGVATLARPALRARALLDRLSGPTVAKTVIAATVVGLLTGFFGVGGGFVAVPTLLLAPGFDTATAVGTSLVVIVINSVTALAPRLGAQAASLDWPLIAVFAVAAIVGVLLGNRVAGRVSARKLSMTFATVLLLMAGYIASPRWGCKPRIIDAAAGGDGTGKVCWRPHGPPPRSWATWQAT